MNCQPEYYCVCPKPGQPPRFQFGFYRPRLTNEGVEAFSLNLRRLHPWIISVTRVDDCLLIVTLKKGAFEERFAQKQLIIPLILRAIQERWPA